MKFTRSIFAKLLLSFVCLSAVPLMLTGWFTFRNAEQELNNKLQRETINILDQKLISLSIYIADMRRMGDTIAANPEVVRFLASGDDISTPGLDVGLNRFLSSAHAIRPENIGITILNNKGLIHTYGYEPSEHINGIRYAAWLSRHDESMNTSSPYMISVLHDRPYSQIDPEQPTFSFIRAIDNGQAGSDKGVLSIDFKIDLLRDLLKNIFLTGGIYSDHASGVIITDREGQMLYPYAAGFFGQDEYTQMEQKYLLIHRYDKTTDWHFTAYFLKSELYKPIRNTRSMSLSATIASIVVCLIAAIIISNRISVPILKLHNLMNKVGVGHFDVQYTGSRKDEIGALGFGFNRMVHRIRDLIQLVYEEQNAKRRAEVTAMQSQINPHFLYNTLESINSLARKNKQQDISRMIVLLGKLLRMSISTFDDMITIAKELDYVRHYLEIHNYRQPKAYSYHIEMEPEIMKLYTVKWILQPIIENTIIHGLETGHRDSGSIEIKGWLENEDVWISIKDNGTGIPEDRLTELQMNLEQRAVELTKHGRKVGLYNVQSRIKLYFGDPYGLQIDSKPGLGTTVTIRLPRRQKP
jgi:two-component system, sensor histidine kinase YesM